jgi:hypothetical protein
MQVVLRGERRMTDCRTLIVTQKLSYLNPAWGLLAEELARRPNVRVIGWGYGRNYSDYREVIGALGRFDVAIVDPWVVGPSRPYLEQSRPTGILDAGIPLVINLMAQDLHTFSEDFFRGYIDRCSFAISTIGSPQFWKRSFAELYPREPWLKPGYVTENPQAIDGRFLLFPHAVSEREFCSVKRRRPIDVSIPGTTYWFRSRAAEALEHAVGLKVKSRATLIERGAARFSVSSRLARRLGAIPVAQFLFRRTLRRSLASITCDGSIGYPIRKFFEIPAAGSILVARPFEQPEALGFRHGDTAFLVSDSDIQRLDDIVHWLKSNSDESRALATRGQEMVREFHMVPRRVDQILEVAEAIAAGKLTGMSWHSAEPVLDLRQGQGAFQFGNS